MYILKSAMNLYLQPRCAELSAPNNRPTSTVALFIAPTIRLFLAHFAFSPFSLSVSQLTFGAHSHSLFHSHCVGALINLS